MLYGGGQRVLFLRPKASIRAVGGADPAVLFWPILAMTGVGMPRDQGSVDGSVARL